MTGLLLALAACGLDPGPQAAPADSAEATAASTCDPDACVGTCCDGQCVDIWSDPDNCGGCGITCLAANAGTVCDVGDCALDVCDEGYGDCDGDEATGCEAEVSCTPGEACATACGSVGSTWCGDPCAPSCVTLDETCNAMDDDCNGSCDEGELPGCRQSVYRSSGPLGHVYGTDPNEPAALGQRVETAEYFFVYAEEQPGLAPLYRCDKGGGRRFLTRSANCEIGLAADLVVGWVAGNETCGAVPLYRLYSSAASNHFYTTSAAERDNAVSSYGYQYESVVAYVWAGR